MDEKLTDKRFLGRFYGLIDNYIVAQAENFKKKPQLLAAIFKPALVELMKDFQKEVPGMIGGELVGSAGKSALTSMLPAPFRKYAGLIEFFAGRRTQGQASQRNSEDLLPAR